MDFTLNERESYWRDRVRDFINSHVRPNHAEFLRQEHEGERWKIIPILEETKAKAKAAGIWNLFMPPTSGRIHVDDSVGLKAPA
jgi:acyl-CoA dehydrogenase